MDRLGGGAQHSVGGAGRGPLVLRASQRERLDFLTAPAVGRAGQVVELVGLPAGRLIDPAPGPRDHFVIAAELGHRLGDSDELVRSREVASEQRDDRVAVAVEHRETLARVPGSEPLLVLLCRQERAELGEPDLAKRGAIAHRVGLEEVLIDEPEPDHPPRELHRIRPAGVTSRRMESQQIAREITDHPGRVVRLRLDHLHHMRDASLEELHQVLARGGAHRHAELGDNRARGTRPLHAFAVAEEPTRPQPAIDLDPQLPQVAA